MVNYSIKYLKNSYESCYIFGSNLFLINYFNYEILIKAPAFLFAANVTISKYEFNHY